MPDHLRTTLNPVRTSIHAPLMIQIQVNARTDDSVVKCLRYAGKVAGLKDRL
jgi:hypothetical protein